MSRTTTGASRPDRKRQKAARALVKLTRDTDAPLSYQRALQALPPEGSFDSAVKLAELLVERGDAAMIPDLIKLLVAVEVGGRYRFFCEVLDDLESPEERLRRFTGQGVKVIRTVEVDDPDRPPAYVVRADDGTEFTAQEEELSGWDYALDQFFWPDGTYGKARSGEFLANERSSSTVTSPTAWQEISHPDEDGEFPLADGSFGNPGCDKCGTSDAVIKVNGEYLCADDFRAYPFGTRVAAEATVTSSSVDHERPVRVLGHGFSYEASLGEVLDQEFNGDVDELRSVVQRLLDGEQSVCVNEGHEHPRTLEVLDPTVVRQQLETLIAATPPAPVNCPGHADLEDCEDSATNPCSACVERGEADDECSRCGALRAKDQHGSAEDWCACEVPAPGLVASRKELARPAQYAIYVDGEVEGDQRYDTADEALAVAIMQREQIEEMRDVTVRPVVDSESSVKALDMDLRGVFADGWTSEEADAVLPRVSKALGLEFRATWEYVDERGTGGHSEIVAVTPNHIALVVPDGLMAFLEDGDGDGRISVPETFVEDTSVKPALMFALGDGNPDCNLVAEDRRPREIVREVVKVVLTADKTTRDYAEAAVSTLGDAVSDDEAVEHFLESCPDDVPATTLEFLDGELEEAAGHADEEGTNAAVCVVHAAALLMAQEPGRDISDVYELARDAAASMYDNSVPRFIAEWIDENLDGAERDETLSSLGEGEPFAVTVEFVELGEGMDGEYDPNDPDDVELLRIDVKVTVGGREFAVTDGSYCTRVPAETDAAVRERILERALGSVRGPIEQALAGLVAEHGGPHGAVQAIEDDGCELRVAGIKRNLEMLSHLVVTDADQDEANIIDYNDIDNVIELLDQGLNLVAFVARETLSQEITRYMTEEDGGPGVYDEGEDADESGRSWERGGGPWLDRLGTHLLALGMMRSDVVMCSGCGVQLERDGDRWAGHVDGCPRVEDAPGAAPDAAYDYTASFTPEAWVRDNAIEVDPEGETEWDCTAFVVSGTVGSGDRKETIVEYLNELDARDRVDDLDDWRGVIDNDDVLKRDPAAPEWIREWRGPFTIRVRRTLVTPS